MLNKLFLIAVVGVFVLSCSSGIKKSRVCSIEDFDPLKGCKSNSIEIIGLPETVVYSFLADGFEKDSRALVYWFYGEGASAVLIDSFPNYIKVDKQLLVSGIDRNFLEPGPYFVKTVISNETKTVEHIHNFTVNLRGEIAITQLIVGDVIDNKGVVIRPKTDFFAQEERVFISANVYNAKAGDEIKIRFKHMEKQFDKEFSTKVGPNPKSSFLLYANLPNMDLPTGAYDAEIKIGNVAYAASFFIIETNNTIPEIEE